MKFTIGTKVQVTDDSGLSSGRCGTVVSPKEIKTDGQGKPINVSGAYKPVDWKREVAVRLENGKLTTMFKNRLKLV